MTHISMKMKIGMYQQVQNVWCKKWQRAQKRRKEPVRCPELLTCSASWLKWGVIPLRTSGTKLKVRCMSSHWMCKDSNTCKQPEGNTVHQAHDVPELGVMWNNACFCWKACSAFSLKDRHIRGTVIELAAVSLNAEVQIHQFQMQRHLELSISWTKVTELCAPLV